jgi:hypothetical protein
MVRVITLMMEAASTSEMVNYQTTQCYNPEDSHLQTHLHENLKSHCVPFYIFLYSCDVRLPLVEEDD